MAENLGVTAGSSETSATIGSSGAPTASAGSTGASTVIPGSTGGSTGSVSFAWSDGWRERLAAGDDKELKRLQRFQSPDDVWKMARSLESRMSSGEIKSTLAKNATAEEAKAWRAENGIPENSDGYPLVFTDGSAVPEEDKPVLKTFLDVAHKLNFTPDQVKASLDWQYQNAQRMTETQQNADKELIQKTVEELRAEWGADYRANTNMIQTNLDRAGKELAELVMRGRTADGRPLGSVPEVLKWIVANEREISPAGTVVPGSGASQATAIADELNNLTKMMGDRQSDYWRGPKAEYNQTRYRQLIDASDKLKAKAA